MDIPSAKLIYFSPTHTTKRVVEGIARGLRIDAMEHADLTQPDASSYNLGEIHDALAVIASPVYGGRLPLDVVSRLQRLKGRDAPAVIVVVYGNRAYEDALLELRDLALAAGFQPVAAGAFIGEHSYSSGAMPIAVGRPDAEDLRKAEDFGTLVRTKLRDMRALGGMAPLQVPGNFPYLERRLLTNIAPVSQDTLCERCEQCAAVCPVAAITFLDTVVTDNALCIRCCACVRACPAGARVMDDPRIAQMAQWLNTNCAQRKEPETYV